MKKSLVLAVTFNMKCFNMIFQLLMLKRYVLAVNFSMKKRYILAVNFNTKEGYVLVFTLI